MPQEIPVEPSVWRWVYPAAGNAAGARADRALLDALEMGLGEWVTGSAVSCSRSRIKTLIEEGQVSLNGEPLRPSARPHPGDVLEIRFPPPRRLELVALDQPLEILHEDSHLVIVNKPPGLTVHPSDTQAEGTLVNILLHHIRDLSGIGGALRPGIVHRVDKDTSGALVVTKTDEAHRTLVRTFAEHAIDREYWALCFGAPSQPGSLRKPTRIEGAIGRSPADRKKMAIVRKGGRPAVTYFRMREEYGVPGKRPFASWLEVNLETGRTHQIRVHLTSAGNSLLGDPVYGAAGEKQAKWLALPEEVRAAVRALPGQALHARVLGFVHPVTGEQIRVEAEVPPAFRALQEALAHYL